MRTFSFKSSLFYYFCQLLHKSLRVQQQSPVVEHQYQDQQDNALALHDVTGDTVYITLPDTITNLMGMDDAHINLSFYAVEWIMKNAACLKAEYSCH